MKNKLIDLLTRKLTEIYGESPATQIIALQIAGELLAAGMLAEPVKHGKPNPHIVRWIGDDGEVILADQVGYECPFCGEDGVKNYCPNCGMKMDLEG